MQWISQHSLLSLLVLAGIFTLVWLWSQRSRLRLSPILIPLLAAGHVLVGVFCVKLFAILESGSLKGPGGMSLFGAAFFLPIFYWLGARLTKRKARDVFDVFVVPMVFTLACARVNCLLTGCCLGRPIPGTGFRYPTREAELVYYAVLLPVLIYRTRKRTTVGTLYPIYMMSYGAFRFVVEFFREAPSGTLFHLSHFWALLSLSIGAAIYFEQRQRLFHTEGSSRKHRRKKK